MPRSGNTRREPAEQVSNAEDTLLTVEEVLTRAQELIGAETQSGSKSANYYTNAPYFRAHACRDLPEARKALGVLCLWHFRKSPPQEKLRWAIEGREWLEPLSNDLYVRKWLVEFEWYSTPNTSENPQNNDLLTDSNDDDGMGADALINKKLEELWNLLAELGVPEGERAGWVAARMGKLLPTPHIPSSARAQFRAAIFRAADNQAVPPDDGGQDEGADIGKGATEPQTIQATMPDETLVRLTLRYEKLLQDIDLPDDGLFKTKEQARAAARIASTYQNLRKRQIARGLEPLQKDSRVTEAERLREAFYRKARQSKPSL